MSVYYTRMAHKLARKYETRDAARIARQMGIAVLYVPMSQVFGLAVSLGKHKFIGVKASLPERAQKLVISHELGHFILHPRDNFMFIVEHTFFHGKHEYQANMFAFGLQLGEDVTRYEPIIREIAAGKVDKLINKFK